MPPAMASNSDTAALLSLQQNVEALALEVALRDLSSPERIAPLIPMLAEIRQQAYSAGMNAVVAAAVAPGTESGWRDLVSSIQQLVASGAAAAPGEVPVAPPALASLN